MFGTPSPTDWVKSELMETLLGSHSFKERRVCSLPIGLNRN